jgi:glycerate 2-kinase
MDVLVRALAGERRAAAAHDPLGRPIEAEYGLIRDGTTAVVEVAAASGLTVVEPEKRDPVSASSAGTGELIAAAIDGDAERVLVAAGGSGTTDGGDGAIKALETAGGLRGARLEVLCDTTVPFERAAEVFAAQKGASAGQVELLTDRLIALAAALPRDPRRRAMSGAAGGLSGGLWAAFGARLIPGAATVLGMLGFDRRLEETRAVITGEGRLDSQSLDGKLVGEIARRCRAARVPVHAVAGRIELERTELAALGLASAIQAGTAQEIADAAERIAAGG